jgi:hypothetical protein
MGHTPAASQPRRPSSHGKKWATPPIGRWAADRERRESFADSPQRRDPDVLKSEDRREEERRLVGMCSLARFWETDITLGKFQVDPGVTAISNVDIHRSITTVTRTAKPLTLHFVN